MSQRAEDWTITVEYSGVDFAGTAGTVAPDQKLPRHSVIQRGSSHRLLIFLRESETTIGEALRRLPRRLQEIERLLTQPAPPASIEISLLGYSRPEELISLSEVAAILQVSRQRAQQLSKQPDFPRPKGTPKSGPVYLLSDAEDYKTHRNERLDKRKLGG